MRVAVIHYWLVTTRGGERVLDSILRIYPGADVFTHVINPQIEENLNKRGHRVFKTFISDLPFSGRMYQIYLPLMPLALEQLDLRAYDLVISSESGPSKGVIVPPGVPHICYCHTPMRYVWDMYFDYMKNVGRFKRFIMRPLIHYLRMWDRLSAANVDHFIANSRFVAARIERFYRRQSTVIHPPVNGAAFSIGSEQGDFFLMVGQLVPYKCTELGVQAFNKLGLPLVIIGEGQDFKSLKQKAKSNVTLLGRQSDEVIRDHLQRCRALIFPGVEDFGIVPLEAMACGRPVIAYGAGGACETVIDGLTGLFFYEQTEESLVEAVERFNLQDDMFYPDQIRKHALTFDKASFEIKIKNFIDEVRSSSLPNSV